MSRGFRVKHGNPLITFQLQMISEECCMLDAQIVSREFQVKPGNPLSTFQLQMISVAPGQHRNLKAFRGGDHDPVRVGKARVKLDYGSNVGRRRTNIMSRHTEYSRMWHCHVPLQNAFFVHDNGMSSMCINNPAG